MLHTPLKAAPLAEQLSFAEGAWPDAHDLRALMQTYGMVHLRGFYREDPAFLAYVDELRWCAGALMERHGISPRGQDDLEGRINQLFTHEQTLPMPLYYLGTQPMKLASGNAWKFSERSMAAARAALNGAERIGTPAASDSFIGHHPGEAFQRYVLPIHQDYPYLLQSEETVTFWVPMSQPDPGLGGVTLWPTSHAPGPRNTRLNADGHLEAAISDQEPYPQIDITDWQFGDLVLMHGSLLHRGHHNHTTDRTRLLQVFRFTDLDQPVARETAWASRTYPRPGATYDDVFPLFAKHQSD